MFQTTLPAKGVLSRNTCRSSLEKARNNQLFSHWIARLAKRLSGYGPEGREFKSSSACQKNPCGCNNRRDFGVLGYLHFNSRVSAI